MGDSPIVDSNNIKRCHRQTTTHCLGLVVDGGGRERTLWIVDRAQIEHRRLLMFALGVTNPQHD